MNVWTCLFGIFVIQNVKDIIMDYINNEEYHKGYDTGYKKGCENKNQDNG